MKALFVHPSPLMYSEIYLKLEPLGLELVTSAARMAGHDVKLLDLQAATHKDLFAVIDSWKPEAVAFSVNYLANIPEVIDLTKEIRRRLPESFIFVGGHSASFTAREILEHADGAIDCVVRGEGEEITPKLLAAWQDDKKRIADLPGIVTLDKVGPHPQMVSDLNRVQPARDLLPKRRKYFIGVLDPCASIEFTRGCPWDCAFCSAWTFYGRNYRHIDPEICAEDMASIKEPGIFIVDDVAFIKQEHGFAIGEAMEKRGLKKRFYLETRGDVLLRNKEVFQFWKKLGLEYMFLGLEAIDEEGLLKFRKRVTLGRNFEALEYARSLGITVAINIIADPNWDEARFDVIRDWALQVPEIVHMTVNTPYPGTETWVTESRNFTTRDYRLFDVQHAVLPTKMPLDKFYRKLVETQQVLNKKHLGLSALKDTAIIAAKHLMHGQTNFVKMLWKFNSVYNPQRQFEEHQKAHKYNIALPTRVEGKVDAKSLYVHNPELETTRENETLVRNAEQGGPHEAPHVP